jgi:hypothetical protein
MEIIKGANGKWRYGIGTHWISPGLELNDLGFQNNADMILEGQTVGYVENSPKGIFRTYEFDLTQLNFWNFGGEYVQSEWELETSLLLKTNGILSQFDREKELMCICCGRFQRVCAWKSRYFLSTDRSKKVSLKWVTE